MQVSTLFPSDLDFNDKAKLGSIISAIRAHVESITPAPGTTLSKDARSGCRQKAFAVFNKCFENAKKLDPLQDAELRSLGCELFRLAMGVHSRKPSSGVLNIPYDSAVLLIKSHGRTAKAFVDAKLDALAERHFELAVDYWENYSDVSNLVASIPEVGYQLMQWRSSFDWNAGRPDLSLACAKKALVMLRDPKVISESELAWKTAFMNGAKLIESKQSGLAMQWFLHAGEILQASTAHDIKTNNSSVTRKDNTRARLARTNRAVAVCLVDMGRLQEALSAIEESLQANPTVEALFVKARIMILLKQEQEVATLMPQIISHNDVSPEMAGTLLEFASQQDMVDLASRGFDQLSERYPAERDGVIATTKLKCLLEKGRTRDALEFVDSLSTATDEMLTAMSAQAVASFDAGDYGMAISWFRRLLKLLDPKDTQNRSYCLTSLAQCYFEEKNYELSLECAETASTVSHAHASSLHMVRALLKLNREQDALAVLAKTETAGAFHADELCLIADESHSNKQPAVCRFALSRLVGDSVLLDSLGALPPKGAEQLHLRKPVFIRALIKLDVQLLTEMQARTDATNVDADINTGEKSSPRDNSNSSSSRHDDVTINMSDGDESNDKGRTEPCDQASQSQILHRLREWFSLLLRDYGCPSCLADYDSAEAQRNVPGNLPEAGLEDSERRKQIGMELSEMSRYAWNCALEAIQLQSFTIAAELFLASASLQGLLQSDASVSSSSLFNTVYSSPDKMKPGAYLFMQRALLMAGSSICHLIFDCTTKVDDEVGKMKKTLNDPDQEAKGDDPQPLADGADDVLKVRAKYARIIKTLTEKARGLSLTLNMMKEASSQSSHSADNSTDLPASTGVLGTELILPFNDELAHLSQSGADDGFSLERQVQVVITVLEFRANVILGSRDTLDQIKRAASGAPGSEPSAVWWSLELLDVLAMDALRLGRRDLFKLLIKERIARACAQPIVPTLDVIRMYTHIVLTESDQDTLMHTFDEIIRFATANLTALAAQMATAPRPTSDSEDDPLINARALVSLSWNYGAAAYKIQDYTRAEIFLARALQLRRLLVVSPHQHKCHNIRSSSNPSGKSNLNEHNPQTEFDDPDACELKLLSAAHAKVAEAAKAAKNAAKLGDVGMADV